jgi:hypothetical protein
VTGGELLEEFEYYFEDVLGAIVPPNRAEALKEKRASLNQGAPDEEVISNGEY